MTRTRGAEHTREGGKRTTTVAKTADRQWVDVLLHAATLATDAAGGDGASRPRRRVRFHPDSKTSHPTRHTNTFRVNVDIHPLRSLGAYFDPDLYVRWTCASQQLARDGRVDVGDRLIAVGSYPLHGRRPPPLVMLALAIDAYRKRERRTMTLVFEAGERRPGDPRTHLRNGLSKWMASVSGVDRAEAMKEYVFYNEHNDRPGATRLWRRRREGMTKRERACCLAYFY